MSGLLCHSKTYKKACVLTVLKHCFHNTEYMPYNRNFYMIINYKMLSNLIYYSPYYQKRALGAIQKKNICTGEKDLALYILAFVEDLQDLNKKPEQGKNKTNKQKPEMSAQGNRDRELDPVQAAADEAEGDNNKNENENENETQNKGTKEKTRKGSKDSEDGSTTHNNNSNTTGGVTTNGNNEKNKGRQEQNEKAKLQILREVFAQVSKNGKLDKSMLPPSVCRSECMKLWRQILTTEPIKGIKILKLRWCAIQSPGAKVLADGLINSCMHSLEILDLMGNEIGVSGTRAIAGLLAPGIDLDSFQVTDVRSVLAGFEGRERIGCLKALNLSYNCTSDAGCGYLGKAICISNTIRRLSLENCEISDNGCKYLRRGIERNNTLTHLNIAANRFGDLGAREIQTFLLRNNSLQKLDISRNRLGAQRTMDIAKGFFFACFGCYTNIYCKQQLEGLTMNHSLKTLRMNINRTGARGAQVLAKMLINNHTLEELELSYNEIFNDGVQVLAQGLIQNHGLKRLVLWY
ncbi:hypothetical protein RFI_17258, partial [Reticulomyxa filosa]